MAANYAPGFIFSYEIRHTNDPPISPGRFLQEAVVTELLSMSSNPLRVHVYAEWADGFKYLQSWQRTMFDLFMKPTGFVIEDKGRAWTPALHKQLVADYNCPVRIRRRAKGYVDHADASE